MSLIDQFLILAAIICSFSGCAAVSMDRAVEAETVSACLLYTSPSPRD